MNSTAIAESAVQQLLDGIPHQQHQLELAGMTTSVLEAGSGPNVVLLHGQGEYAAKWFRILPALMRSNRVIAPDLPGHGNTYVTDGDVSAPRVLDWLGQLIERTCPGSPPVVVGHITSGAIAARFAAVQSAAISQLVLVDALGLAPFEPTPEFGQALMAFVMQPNHETHEALWEQCAYDLPALRTSMGERWDALEAFNIDRAGVAAHQPVQQALMQEFGFPPIPEATLASITVPTSLIWGRHDLATRLEVAQGASERYGWPLHIIENAADDPAGEQPAAFVQTLRRILTA